MLIRSFITALCISLLPSVSVAYDRSAQRESFRQAYDAIQNKDYSTAQTLTESLRDYPLYYFLRYHLLRAEGDNLTHAEVQAFLARYGESVVGENLRQDWLTKLANQQAWTEYLSIYTPQKSVVLQCAHVQARLTDSAQVDSALQDMKVIWLTAKALPDACNAPTNALYNSPIMDDELVWQRMRLALQKKSPDLAVVLSKRLKSSPLQSWANRLLTAHRNPATVLDGATLPNTPHARDTVLHAIRRVAGKEAATAKRYWERLQRQYTFSAEQQGEILRDIALQAAAQHHPQAIQLLSGVPADAVTEELSERRLLYALETQNWQAVANFIENIPEDQKDTSQAQYWMARALEQLGKSDAATATYQNAAKIRDYYGFMAASRINAPYQMQDIPTVYSEGEADTVLRVGGIERAFELYYVGLNSDARKEWQSTVKNLSPRQMEIAAALASRTGWYERAVMTAVKASNFDDLNVRFPLAFHKNVSAAAAANNVDLAWAYGIVRQESAFMWDARSHVGALGLMQLMPATGRMMAKRAGVSIGSERDILQIDNNVALGTSYLRMLYNQFDGNYMLATAGYNAGPGRSKAWLAKYGCLPADVWVEMIPFTETKLYVKRVLFFTSVFEARLGLPSQPMRIALPSDSCNDTVVAVPKEIPVTSKTETVD